MASLLPPPTAEPTEPTGLAPEGAVELTPAVTPEGVGTAVPLNIKPLLLLL